MYHEVTNSQGASKARHKTVVVKNSLPSISLPNTNTLMVGDAFDSMANVTALDKEDGDITDRIQVSGEVNTKYQQCMC